MQQFNLAVTGVEGALSATLTFGDQTVATFEAKTVKEAQRRARSEAASFTDANRPERLVSYTERFSV